MLWRDFSHTHSLVIHYEHRNMNYRHYSQASRYRGYSHYSQASRYQGYSHYSQASRYRGKEYTHPQVCVAVLSVPSFIQWILQPLTLTLTVTTVCLTPAIPPDHDLNLILVSTLKQPLEYVSISQNVLTFQKVFTFFIWHSKWSSQRHTHTHARAHTHRERNESEALPWPDWGPWERVEATCGIHNTPVFIQRKCGKKEPGKCCCFFSEIISSFLDETSLRKCVRQLSHPPTIEMGRFWRSVWPAEPWPAAESRLDGPWLSQVECVYELLGFGSRVSMRVEVIPHWSGETGLGVL